MARAYSVSTRREICCDDNRTNQWEQRAVALTEQTVSELVPERVQAQTRGRLDRLDGAVKHPSISGHARAGSLRLFAYTSGRG